MQYRFYSMGQDQLACTSRRPTGWRQLLPIALGLILWLSIKPDSAFGQTATVELSPLVAKSTFVSPVDRNQQLSVVLVEQHVRLAAFDVDLVRLDGPGGRPR